MGEISKWCPICGAAPGEPCVSSEDESRSHPHFYRHNDHPISVLVKDEPPVYEFGSER